MLQDQLSSDVPSSSSSSSDVIAIVTETRHSVVNWERTTARKPLSVCVFCFVFLLIRGHVTKFHPRLLR